jgi:superfamily I DNA and/or RNA helicase
VKESFTNEVEANAVVDYLSAFSVDGSCAVMTPYRTQSLVIKNCIEERLDDLPAKLVKDLIVGSYEDFMGRSFKTIVVSLCRSTYNDQQLQAPHIVAFLLSRL